MSGSMVEQRTLTGEEAEIDGLEIPSTFVECPECGEHVLRSRQFDHEHEIRFAEGSIRTSDTELDDHEDEEDDEPERVGAWYTIELSYSVDYRFRVPAWDEHQAEDIAKDWKLDAAAADSHHVHTERREVSEITAEDVPDDFDPCGPDRLVDVLLGDGDA